MPKRKLRAEKLDEFLPCRPNRFYDPMIDFKKPANPRDPLLYSASPERISSLGDLDLLPPEINHKIISMLDPKSLASLSRVSSRGNALVESSVPFKSLVANAPEVFVALDKAGMGGHHSIGKLYAIMKEQKCSNCTEYGPFLFIPNCMRCCWPCLRGDSKYRVFMLDQASQYFGLLPCHLEKLPTLDAIPGKYGILNHESPTCSLVSVKEARELAIEVHGSEDNLVQFMEETLKTDDLLTTGRFYLGEEALKGKDLRVIPNPGHPPLDSFFGMATIPFPSLSSSNRFESGFWCRGCETNTERDTSHSLLGSEARPRSRANFLRHLRHCYSARKVVPALAPFQSYTSGDTGLSQDDS